MNGSERRKSKRRDILENFSFYIQIPKIGPSRHRVKDVSESGIGFSIDTMGGTFKMEKGEVSELHLYLNQSLYLSLKIEIVRLELSQDEQNLGAIILDTKSDQYSTYLTLVKFLDQLGDCGHYQKS
jgi:PilZ domain